MIFAHDFVNQVHLQTSNTFIITHILSPQLNAIYCERIWMKNASEPLTPSLTYLGIMLNDVCLLPELPSDPVDRRRPSRSERLEYFENGLTQNRQISHGHPYRPKL